MRTWTQFVLVSTLLFTLRPYNSYAENYCLALRGNGELAPAHWGALAQVVEKLGLPGAMSGGSSASISLFLLESISQNPTVRAAGQPEQKLRASLLLKSLQGYLEVIMSRPEWREMGALAAYLKQQGGGDGLSFMVWLKQMMETEPEKLAALVIKNYDAISKSLEAAAEIGIIDPKTFMPIIGIVQQLRIVKDEKQRLALSVRLNFLAGEVHQSVSLFGKFDAETDHNLFFRPGIVNFAQLAVSFGKLGNFYSAREFTPAMSQSLENLVANCAQASMGKTWTELRRQEPKCDSQFKALVNEYAASGLPKKSLSRNEERVGKYISSFPTTAVLTGSAYQTAKAAIEKYPLSMDPEFGKNFSVNAADVKFGYWGRKGELAKVDDNLKKNFATDEKSRLFKDLGESTWAQVLALSPAEPGLAPLQLFTTNGEAVFSAGGWSDLHPVAVLKAHGCNQVIYVTRRGGESLFAQGVAKRLLGFPEVKWDQISTREPFKSRNKITNNLGNSGDMSSQWSRLFNLANPKSSMNLALKLADAVVCTDWNRFEVTDPGGVEAMIGEAYRAPVLRKHSAPDNSFDPALGYKPYAGCLP